MKLWVSIVGALVAVACSSDDQLPPYDSGLAGQSGGGGSGTRAAGGSGTRGGDAGHPSGPEDAGAAGESGASDGGAGGESQAGTASGGSAPFFPCASSAAPPMGALCDPDAKLGKVTTVPVDGAGAARLIAITPDELTLAWASPNEEGARFFVADRPTPADTFDALAQISTSDNVVGLSPDGLRLVTLSRDGSTYGELTRDMRGQDFGASSTALFAKINAAGRSYSDCVISADDSTLIYTALTDDAEEYPIKVSTRSGQEPWPEGSALSSCDLQRHGALVRHPTGLSKDGLTLFFFDAARKHARAGWRSSANADFSFFRDLDGVGPAAVNEDCSILYYSGVFPPTGLAYASLSRSQAP